MFQLNVNDTIEPLAIYLVRPDGTILCQLDNYISEDDSSLKINLNQHNELSLTVTSGGENKLEWFNAIQEGMYLFVNSIGYFKMKQPTITSNGVTDKKTITAYSCDVELEDLNIKLEINMGTKTSMEYLVVYNESETEPLLNPYTGVPLDWIVLYNTFPEQLAVFSESITSGHFGSADAHGDIVVSDSELIDELESLFKLIPRLKNKIEFEGDQYSLVEYAVFGYDDGGELESITITSSMQARISALITFYTKYREQLSLLSIALEGTNGSWDVGDIYGVSDGNYSIANKKYQFSTDTNVYAFLTQDFAKASNCIITFDTFNRKVNVTPVDNVGEDSGVVLSYDNILNQLNISCDEDSLSTRLYVTGGDSLGIEQVNFGLDYIDDLSYKMNCVDVSGDRIYVSDALAAKYNSYAEFVEIQRESYIALTRQINSDTKKIDEIKYRVPLDSLKTDWQSFSPDELSAALKHYKNLMETLVSLYKEDVGESGVNQDGTVKESVMKETVYWTDYMAYKCTIKEIEYAIALNGSTTLTTSEINAFEAATKEWETEWTLYGTVELQAKINSYKQNMGVLEESASIILDGNGAPIQWSNLTSAQKAQFGNTETNYQYTIYKNYYDNCADASAYLSTLNAEIAEIQEDIDDAKSDRSTIANSVKLSENFTDAELRVLTKLTRAANYDNDNIITTSIDTTDDKIDRMIELLEDGKKQASIVSRPQLTFAVDSSNLLSLIDYRSCWSKIQAGNYILVQYRDDEFVKLRIVSISFNPSLPSGTFGMTFSNYITSNGDRTDLEYMLNSLSVSSGGGSSGSSSSGGENLLDGIDETISNTMLAQLLNSETFGTRVKDVILDTIDVGTIIATRATIGGLAGGATKIDAGCIQTGKLYDSVYADLVQIGTITLGAINNTSGSIIDLDTGKFNFGGKIVFDGTGLAVTGAITATSLSTGSRTSSSTGTNGIFIDSSGNFYAGSNNQVQILANGTFNLGDKLTWNGSSLSINGSVTATSGYIGGSSDTNGWAITNGKIETTYTQDGGTKYMGMGITGTAWAFYANAATSGGSDGVFRVGHDGVLYATGANVSGTINANSGKIGGANGWNVTTNKIYTGTVDSGTASGDITLSSADFTRSINSTSRSGLRFAVGSNFGLSKTGALYAAGATISGNITATTFRANGSDSDIYCTIGDQITFYNNKSNSDVRILYGRSVYDDTTNPVTYSGVGIYTNSIAFSLTGSSTGYITYMGARAFQIDRDVQVDRHLDVYGDLSVAGNIYDKNGSTVTGSDFAIKNTISSLEKEKSADFIYSLNPVSFKYNEGTSNRLHHGFIAQDVKHSMGEDDWGVYVEVTPDNSDDTYIGLRYGELIADIVATIQQQKDRIESLESLISQ